MQLLSRRGAVLAGVAATLYVVLWAASIAQPSWLGTVDSWALDPLYEFGAPRPEWVQFWDVFCAVFGPEAFRLAGAAVIVVAVVQRNMRAVLFLLVVIEISGAVTAVAKAVADRARPETALTVVSGTAFPSGHALGVMASVLALLAVSAGTFGRRTRTLTVVLGALVVVAVGAGRVVLNVHHPSDVVAGWALGYLWFLLWLALIQPTPLRLRRAVSGGAADETPAAPDRGP